MPSGNMNENLKTDDTSSSKYSLQTIPLTRTSDEVLLPEIYF